jgi:hypothetical protein
MNNTISSIFRTQCHFTSFTAIVFHNAALVPLVPNFLFNILYIVCDNMQKSSVADSEPQGTPEFLCVQYSSTSDSYV